MNKEFASKLIQVVESLESNPITFTIEDLEEAFVAGRSRRRWSTFKTRMLRLKLNEKTLAAMKSEALKKGLVSEKTISSDSNKGTK